MPLRILLADESTNIKKAFQIALGDLGAEIKSVPSGLDVLSVALDFKPTIIFADVLLSKKSGYEVCREITANHETKKIPVVLMWSNFMEFNTTLANQVGYGEKLEKPFDTAALRKIITRFYKETETHPLNGLIDFPNILEFSDEFTPVKLPNNVSAEENFQVSESRNNNSIHIETESHGDFEEVVLVQSGLQRSDEQSKISHQIKNYLENSPVAQAHTRFDESLIREEVRIMAEKICWQLIPEITERLVKEELEKLMQNIEKSI